MRRVSALREGFWRAFWRRQAKHLPPNTEVHISNCHFVSKRGNKGPALTVETGREWKENANA